MKALVSSVHTLSIPYICRGELCQFWALFSMADHAFQPLTLQRSHVSHCCELSKINRVYLLNLTGIPENRLSVECIQQIDALLDQVVEDEEACALIVTNQGKFFSNGMDVEYLGRVNKQKAQSYLMLFQRLLSKLLTFCLPTIAVIRGHAVGAGCAFALAHDYRIMTSDKGYIFMNEVNLGMSLLPGIADVLRAKLPPLTFQGVVLTGKRYDGRSALAAGIVHGICAGGDNLLQLGIEKALEYAAKSWKREIYNALKMEIYKNTKRELENGGIGFARM